MQLTDLVRNLGPEERTMKTHVTVLSKSVTYGKGYCGICGDQTNIVPRLIKWWCPDDGWQVGVLCDGCTAAAEVRGPKESDFAYRKAERQAEKIGVLSDVLGDDADGMITEAEECLYDGDE